MLAIIWHSRTGAAQAMATAAQAGALAAQAEAMAAQDGAATQSLLLPPLLLPAAQATPEVLLSASAYLFICPENLGSMSGAMKEMFDQAYYPLIGKIEGRPYATAIAAGSDGQGAQAQIDRIVTGWRLRRVAEPVIVNLGVQTPEDILSPKTVSRKGLALCRDLGGALSAGVALGVF